MIKLEELQKEVSKYQIPDKDDIITWFIKGDKSASDEVWNFFRRSVVGMSHLDDNLGGLISVAKLFEKTKKDFGSNDVKDYDTISNTDMKKLITTFLDYGGKDISELINESQLFSTISKYVDIRPYRVFYKTEQSAEKLNSISSKLEKVREKIENLKHIYQNDNMSHKQIIIELEKMKLKVFRLFTRKQLMNMVKREIDVLIHEESKLNSELELEKKQFFESYKSDNQFYFDGSLSDSQQKYAQWINDIFLLLEKQVNSQKCDYLNLCRKISRINSINAHPIECYDELKQSIHSAATVFKLIMNPEFVAINDFDKLVEEIRNVIITGYPADKKIGLDYRDEFLNDNDGFIKGADYSKEKIVQEMSKLSKRFDDIMQIGDIEQYIRKTVDLAFDLMLIHPYKDGNGRTARLFIQIMLAKRDIVIPSLFDSDFSRKQYRTDKEDIMSGKIIDSYLDNFSVAEDLSAYNNDYSYIEEYIINRIKKFYPQLLSKKIGNISLKNENNPILDNKSKITKFHPSTTPKKENEESQNLDVHYLDGKTIQSKGFNDIEEPPLIR